MLKTIIGAVALAAAFATPAAAATFTDATGDYLAGYVGARNGDLDVVSFSVDVVGRNFVLSATMDGAIGTTPGGIYVWGVDRGAGQPGFGASLGLTGVLFDSVVILRPDLGAIVNLLAPNPTALTGAVTVSGNTITGTIPIALLPSNGFDRREYGFNLWPRLAGGDVTNIADFAPDNATVVAGGIPEPAAWALMIGGFGLVGTAMRRRASRPVALTA